MSYEISFGPPPVMERSAQDPTQFIRRSNFFHRGDSYPATPDAAIEVRDAQIGILREYGVLVPEYKTLGLFEMPVDYTKGLGLVEAVDYIDGEVLTEAMIREAPIDEDALNAHYNGLIKYMDNVHQSGGFYLSDVSGKNDQVMWGRRADDTDPRLYMMDVEPILEEFNKRNPEDRTNAFYFERVNWLGSIIRLATSFGYDVSDARQNFDDFQKLVAA